jgi:predicted Zn-dependent protease
MKDRIIRRIGASLVISSVWLTATAIPLAAQTTTASSSSAKTDDKKKDKKDVKAKPAPTPAATGTLSDNDNPAMIGKRNINGGFGDKVTGKLGGSREKEIAMGRQLAAEVEQQSKMVDDPVVTEYVNRVGQNIVLHSDAKVPFTIKVIDSDEVNAFALPGGYFFVNKGLILAADNEAELAGVMAHEIGHVAARHAMEMQGKGALIQWGAIAGIIFGGPIAATVLQNAGGILAGLAGLKFTRAAESEADNLGVQYLYAAGYDPTALSTMFEKLAAMNKKKPGAIAKLFSTHPENTDRHDRSLQLVARFPEKDEYVISTSEFQRVKAHLMKLTNAKAGITTDYDNPDEGRPTLKKRQPEPDSTDTATGDSSSSNDNAPPKLKKRDEEQPAPTPSPAP